MDIFEVLGHDGATNRVVAWVLTKETVIEKDQFTGKSQRRLLLAIEDQQTGKELKVKFFLGKIQEFFENNNCITGYGYVALEKERCQATLNTFKKRKVSRKTGKKYLGELIITDPTRRLTNPARH